MNLLSFGLIALLMVCGCIFLAEQFFTWLWRPETLPEFVVLLPLTGRVENVEQLVRYHESWIRWNTAGGRYRLILLDKGMDSQTEAQCRLLMREEEHITLLEAEELAKRL